MLEARYDANAQSVRDDLKRGPQGKRIAMPGTKGDCKTKDRRANHNDKTGKALRLLRIPFGALRHCALAADLRGRWAKFN